MYFYLFFAKIMIFSIPAPVAARSVPRGGVRRMSFPAAARAMADGAME